MTRPNGYIIMTAGEIAEGCAAHLAEMGRRRTEWESKLPGALLAWAAPITFWNAPNHAPPKAIRADGQKLVEWYLGLRWYHRPSLPIGDCPQPSDAVVEWSAAVSHLDAKKRVWIDVYYGSYIHAWAKKYPPKAEK